MQARTNLKSMQRLAQDEDVNPPFQPNLHRSTRGRSAGPAGHSPNLNFDNFLQRQQLHIARKEEHVQVAVEQRAMAATSPGLSPGTQRILAERADREAQV